MIPLESYPTFVTSDTTVHVNGPGTYVIATASGPVTVSMPRRNQSPGATGLPLVGPQVNAYRIIALPTCKPITIQRESTGSDTFHVAGAASSSASAITSVPLMPGESVLIVDDGLFWVPMYSDRLDALGLGVVMTTDPRRSVAGATWVAANRGIYVRTLNGGVISKIGLEVAVSSGNISVAAYRNSGSGLSATPADRLATSGAVACPAASAGVLREVALDAAVRVAAGDWLFLSCDNTTASFTMDSPALSTFNGAFACRQDTAHPAPSPAGTIAATTRIPILVGIP